MHEGLQHAVALGGWGQVLLTKFFLHLAMLCLQLEVEAASMLVHITPLMGIFFLRLLSSFFFSTQYAYHAISFLFARMLSILLDMHFLHPLGVAVPDEV